MRTPIPASLLATALLFAIPGQAAAEPAISADEYAARRARLAEALGPDALLLMFSPEAQRRNGDVDWPFRQEDNLFYLTGVDEPETVLAMLPGEAEHREVLFARDSDPLAEAWTGRIPGHDELSAASGVAEVVSTGRFGEFLDAALRNRWWIASDVYRYYRLPGMPRFTEALRAGRATVWMLLEQRPGEDQPLTAELRRAEDLRRRFPELRFRDATPILEALREVKSPAEIAILRRAVDVSVAAHEAGMRRTVGGAEYEYQVQATIEFVFRDLGADGWGYPSIVASGRNAATLHYVTNDAPIPRDGLMLFDVGAEVAHYSADVTRTFPVSGTFSEPQREVYEAVLRAWDAGLERLRAGSSLGATHERTETVLGEGLLALGLIAENRHDQVTLYTLHGIGHPIGMAVHDAFDRARRLEPGMVVTLEPGIYVRQADVLASDVYQALADDARAAIAAALARYADIGVRIEDDVLITAGEPEVLSDALPRTVAGLEAFLAGGSAPGRDR